MWLAVGVAAIGFAVNEYLHFRRSRAAHRAGLQMRGARRRVIPL